MMDDNANNNKLAHSSLQQQQEEDDDDNNNYSPSPQQHEHDDNIFCQSSSTSQIDDNDPEALLLTQLHPPTMRHDDNNNSSSQTSVPLERSSQCSQEMMMMMLATQPTMLQTQFSNSNNDDENDDGEEANNTQSSTQQQLLFTTQLTSTQYYADEYNNNNNDDEDDDELNDDEDIGPITQQFNTQQENSSEQLLLGKQQQQSSSSINGEYKQHRLEDSNDDNVISDKIMIVVEQRTNNEEHEEVVEFYNTQGGDEHDFDHDHDDEDDDDSDHDDDMERIVEEQNLAVSLSMEIIESQGSHNQQQQKSIEFDQEVQCSSRHEEEEEEKGKLLESLDDTTAKCQNDNNDGQEVPVMKQFGFATAGSGKAITVNEDEIAKAANMLADNNDVDVNMNAAYDDEQHSFGVSAFNTTGGFASAGSGKAITVNEEEMAKATNLLADNNDDVDADMCADYDTQVEPDQHAFAMNSMGGFATAGSGKAIAVNEEEMSKAVEVLTGSGGVELEENNEAFDDHQDKSDQQAFAMNSMGGFATAGSGKAIAVNEEEIAKATKVLADKEEAGVEVNTTHDEQNSSGTNALNTTGGFASAGSGKAIAVNEEDIAKATQILADDGDKCEVTAVPPPAVAAVTSKMTPKVVQFQQPKSTTVINPYARKRSIDQISNGGVSKSTSSGIAPAAASAGPTMPTPSRKLVFNPYAKTKQTTKPVVRNPYAKVSTTTASRSSSSVMPQPPKGSSVAPTTTNNDTMQNAFNTFNTSSVILPTPKETSFRLKGISFSLPIAERLPSRNVSYKPAEILTVGELYQYLYGADAPTVNDFRELQSVRITGTLLCVSTSTSAEYEGSKGDLYSNGTFLLLGDPLEKNRFPTKTLPQQQQQSSLQVSNNNASMTRTVTKSRPVSILRNKHTPLVRSGTPALTSHVNGQQITTPVTTNTSTQPVSTTIIKKPIMRGGLLNNSKPKKFVYSSNRNRSSLGGGLHRKFITPKRGATPAATNTTGRVTSSIMRKRPLSMIKSASVSSGRNNVKVETVIQRHPAPLVPVWIGSFLDDDGLDGSVLNDLVMVMGEIVVEHCSYCQERNGVGSDEQPANRKAKSVENDDDKEEAKKDESSDKEAGEPKLVAVKSVRDAALSVAALASKCADSNSQSKDRAKKRPFCGDCICFLSARIVKNANGTDMNLQKESLRVRREYFNQRKRQMESLMQGMVKNQLFSVGCGPLVT